MEHSFTPQIMEVLAEHFPGCEEKILHASQLMQYLNIKTVSADRGSKARGSFSNLYAIYVLVEDYVENGFHEGGDYSEYEGAAFTKLFQRQRELPFGGKLQNHSLNNRVNQEFRKHFPASEPLPIMRDVETTRYWINENLLNVECNGVTCNLAQAVIEVVDRYVQAKQQSFETFIQTCETLRELTRTDCEEATEFILSLLAPNVDARVFEIVSYSVLKFYYRGQEIYFGWTPDKLSREKLRLYKTGRTNANDGGIDFVMKPLGRFFQVTETLDVRKYFLDIDKIERYPITFVVKSTEDPKALETKLREKAQKQYPVKTIVDRYMQSIEEIMNIPTLIEKFESAVKDGCLSGILDEIILQSKVEFNYDDEENGDGEESEAETA